MARVLTCVDRENGPCTGWMVFCPACRCGHKFALGRWTFNGDRERPTFSPSMLVRGCLNHGEGQERYGVCHSFVRDGKIEFLGDCTHELAGQTVDLPDFEE